MVSSIRNALNGVKANPQLSKYAVDCELFVNYLEDISKKWFVVHGIQKSGQFVAKDMPYITRFHETYRKGIVAKFYQLERYMQDNPSPLTMITLTTYQDGEYSREMKGHAVDHEEAFGLLTDSFRKLRQLITNRIFDGCTPDYFYVLEPHASGYPHMHLCYLSKFTQEDEQRIRSLWSVKYGAGEQVDFAFREPEEAVQSIRNYLLKYMRKGFLESGSKFCDEKLSPGQLVFNAMLRKTQLRMWGCSRKLSKVMARSNLEIVRDGDGQVVDAIPKRPDGITWFRTDMHTVDGEPMTVWESNSRKILARFKVLQHRKWSRVYSATMRLVNGEWVTTDHIHSGTPWIRSLSG